MKFETDKTIQISPLNNSREKVLPLESLAALTKENKSSGLIVGLCHGCFDILHFGHLRHFEAAKSMVDILIVTVSPDQFVRKGPNRPVFSHDNRAELVAGLRAVDWVGINRWESAVETIKLLSPSVYIKGQEYETRAEQVNPNFLKEAVAIKEVGGRILFTHEDTSSSTAAFIRLLNPI